MFRKWKIRKALKALTEGTDVQRAEARQVLCELWDTDVAAQVAQILKQVIDGNARPVLVGLLCKALDDDSLAGILDQTTVPALLDLLGSPDGSLRYKIAGLLASLGEPKWQRLVAGDTQEDFERLGSSGDPRALAPLLRALREGDKYDRGGAVLGLGKLGGERAVDALVTSLDDEDWGVRTHAAECLGTLGDRRAADALHKAATRGPLINTSDPRMYGALGEYLDSDIFARRAAAIALGQLGDQRAIPLIEQVLKDDDMKPYSPGTRDAIRALSALQGTPLPEDIVVLCKQCGIQKVHAPPEKRGTTVECPNCEGKVPIP